MNEKLNNIVKGLPSENFEDSLCILVKCGIITSEEATQIQAYRRMEERQQLLDSHPYAVTQGTDGYWRTYIPDPTKKGGRKQIKKRNKKDLEEIVIKSVKDGKAVKVTDIFYQWLDRQLENDSISKATYRRYQATFKKHYISCGWDRKIIEQIRPTDWTDWIEDEIARCQLTAKGLSGLKLITRAIIKRAKRRGLLSYQVTDVLDTIEKKPYKIHKSESEQVFTQEEFTLLRQYLITHPDTRNYGLLILVLTGIRVGELVTLRYDDFLSETCCEIKRTETCYKGEDGLYHYDVKDSPKTEAGFRKVFLPSSFDWILSEMKRLKPDSVFLCEQADGKRMTAQCLRSKMYRVCEKIGISKKSPHKARKTYGTILLDTGTDNKTVISLMGHSNISHTEIFYHKDRKEDAEKQSIVDNIVEFKLA